MKTLTRADSEVVMEHQDLILEALGSIPRYKIRSAQGLSHQINLPLEHVEYYLIELAKRGLVSVGFDRENCLWAQVGKARET